MTEQQTPPRFPTKFYDAYIFDMDGTIYLGDHLLPGAKRVIEQLCIRHIPICYLSNNPTKDPQLYVEKLEKLGLPIDISEVANTVVTMTKWLREHYPEATVFSTAEPLLINVFKTAGIKLSEDPAETDIVVTSYGRTFDYCKLQIAFDAIWFHKRTKLVATNPDRYCLFPGGRGEPNCATIIAAIKACIQYQCEMVVGKLSREMLVEALVGLDVKLENCLMVGGWFGTDIQMVVKAGIDSAMLLTGDSTWQEAEAFGPKNQPTYLLDRMDRLIPAETWKELGWIRLLYIPLSPRDRIIRRG